MHSCNALHCFALECCRSWEFMLEGASKPFHPHTLTTHGGGAIRGHLQNWVLKDIYQTHQNMSNRTKPWEFIGLFEKGSGHKQEGLRVSSEWLLRWLVRAVPPFCPLDTPVLVDARCVARTPREEWIESRLPARPSVTTTLLFAGHSPTLFVWNFQFQEIYFEDRNKKSARPKIYKMRNLQF